MGLVCADCGLEKNHENFSPSQKKRNRPRCRECLGVRQREYVRKNRDKVKAYKSSYYQANKEKLSRQSKERWNLKKDEYKQANQRWAAVHREDMLIYYRERRADFRRFVDSFKDGKPCADCGGVFEPYVMEFDHVRGVKFANVSRMTNYRRKRVVEEISKCEIVCCVCHRIRSHKRRKKPTTPRLISFREWISSLKSKACQDCGKNYPPEAMDFDHREDKKFGISDMWSHSRDRVLEELKKCDVVCANCHRKRTLGVQMVEVAS